MKYLNNRKMQNKKIKEEETMKKEYIINLLTENAAGTNLRSKRDSYLPIAFYCGKMEEKYPTKLSGTEEELYHLKAQLDAIAPELSANVLEHPEQIHLLDYYIYLIDHWNEWKGCTVTYRLLADLVRLATWEGPATPTEEHFLILALEQSGISGEANL